MKLTNIKIGGDKINFNLAFIKTTYLIFAVLIFIIPPYAKACEIAQIMFGKIILDIIPEKDYETALIRHGDFENPKQNYGAFRGEITVDRGGFSVRNNNQEVVGAISPKLRIEGFDDDCDKTQKVTINKVKTDVYVITNGNSPVGTIEGRFPKNSFGVK